MSKYSLFKLWNERYGKAEEVVDYAGRRMLKSAIGNRNSAFEPTIDHIRPISDGGKDAKENIEICHRETNEEKADQWPHWTANGQKFHGKKVKGTSHGYTIEKED